jgi:hypothetical protein
MRQTQIEGPPTVDKMVLRASRIGLSGSLTHDVPLGRTQVQNALLSRCTESAEEPNILRSGRSVTSISREFFFAKKSR